MTWMVGLMFVLIALLCWAWWHAGVEWMRDALARNYREEEIGP